MKFLFVLLCMVIGGAVAWLGLIPEGADILAPLETPDDPAVWSPAIRLAGGVVAGLLASATLLPILFPSKLKQEVQRLREQSAKTNDLLRRMLEQNSKKDLVDEKLEALKLDEILESAEDNSEALYQKIITAELSDTELATNYRLIGELSYVDEPHKALEAYREATKLDGSDFWSWIYLARLEDRQAGDVRAAKAAAESASAVAQTDRDKSVALNDLGLILQRLGDLSAARAAYSESLETRRRLAEVSPDSAEAQRDISASLDRIGDVEVQAGDLVAARSAFAESLEIRRHARRGEPGKRSRIARCQRLAEQARRRGGEGRRSCRGAHRLYRKP